MQNRNQLVNVYRHPKRLAQRPAKLRIKPHIDTIQILYILRMNVSVDAEQVFPATHKHGKMGQMKQEFFYSEDCTHGMIFYDFAILPETFDRFAAVMIALNEDQSAVQSVQNLLPAGFRAEAKIAQMVYCITGPHGVIPYLHESFVHLFYAGEWTLWLVFEYFFVAEMIVGGDEHGFSPFTIVETFSTYLNPPGIQIFFQEFMQALKILV